jgi:hypothetical protein
MPASCDAKGVVIGTDQVLPLAFSVFSALGIRVDDDPDKGHE